MPKAPRFGVMVGDKPPPFFAGPPHVHHSSNPRQHWENGSWVNLGEPFTQKDMEMKSQSEQEPPVRGGAHRAHIGTRFTHVTPFTLQAVLNCKSSPTFNVLP